jgi:hypothetical protein
LSGPEPPRHRAPMPENRAALIPWLLVDGILISPYPVRAGGPTASETDAILAMQRRLMRDRVAAWIDPQDGRLTLQEIASGVLVARAAAHTTVRLR